MKNRFLNRVLCIVFLLLSLSECRKQDKGINPELLKGEWQCYEGYADGEPLRFGEPDDPILRIHFYAGDSVSYLGTKGKYSVDGTAREISVFLGDSTWILYVLKLDHDHLWTEQTLSDNHILEMHFSRLD